MVKPMKKWAGLLLVLLLGFCLTACGTDPRPETPATALASQLDSGYLLEQDLAVQQQVFWRYYLSYDFAVGNGDGGVERNINHSSELRFLPEFTQGKDADWEQVSRYLCDFTPCTRSETVASCWAYDDFVAVAKILLPGAEVLPKDSGWLNYIAEKNCYEAVGWDTSGMVYYLLTEPITCKDGVYTAHFAGFAVGEMWMEDGENAIGNDHTMYELWQHGGESLDHFISEILPGELAAGNLQPCENVEVTFALSDDEELPLGYLSCGRVTLHTN